jgi:Winged helix-turn-helix DNA-binding
MDHEHPIHLSRDALRRIAGLRLPGAQLATFLALLSALDHTGQAIITQQELSDLLGTGAGRVWQSLQALVAAGVIEAPMGRRQYGRPTPYGVASSTAVAIDDPQHRSAPRSTPRRREG